MVQESFVMKKSSTAWTKDVGAYSYFNASTPGFSVFAIALVAKTPVFTEPEQPEQQANITEPETNRSVEPETNATKPPEQPPEQPRKPRWPAVAATLALAVCCSASPSSVSTRGA